MRLTEKKSSRSDCLIVAKLFVNQYPKSFADILKNRTTIGNSYGSLLTQLKTRVEHVNCGSPLSRKRKQKMAPGSSVEVDKGPADQYGCVLTQPYWSAGSVVVHQRNLKKPLKKRSKKWKICIAPKVNESNISSSAENHQCLSSSIHCWAEEWLAIFFYSQRNTTTSGYLQMSTFWIKWHRQCKKRENLFFSYFGKSQQE